MKLKGKTLTEVIIGLFIVSIIITSVIKSVLILKAHSDVTSERLEIIREANNLLADQSYPVDIDKYIFDVDRRSISDNFDMVKVKITNKEMSNEVEIQKIIKKQN